jgi:hypothetical protein
VFASNG